MRVGGRGRPALLAVLSAVGAEMVAGGAAGSTALGAQEVGPENGSLVIVGGALRDPEIVRRFIELAGGPEAPIVVIPTAGGAEAYGPDCRCLELLRASGAVDLTVLHSYDPAEADTEAFVEPLRRAGGVWFPGGRQWRLADAYLGTRTERELWGVLERGGAIGGTSAGASIQGSLLVRGDSRTNTIMLGDHLEGFGYLRGVGIDQHLIRRNRQFDMLEVIEAYPEVLGIGIDENTAVIVEGDDMTVLGAGVVAIYDAGAGIDSGGDFYFLSGGDRFDLSTRTPYREGRSGWVELERVERRDESGGGR